MLNGLYILEQGRFNDIYGPDEQRDIAALVKILLPHQTRASIREHPDALRQADVIFSGWGGPQLDEAFLAAAPRLKMVFHSGGSAADTVTDAAWQRGVQVSTANSVLAIAVAEFTLATTLFSLKRGWQLSSDIREQGCFPEGFPKIPGTYGSTVGLISLGIIARTLIKFLKPLSLNVVAYDPFVTADEARSLGVRLLPSLDELFETSDVVSLHTPWLPQTEGMITGAHLSRMRPRATLINTARGAIVREAELIDVARRRTDLQFVLDVTYPEPPVPGSPLYSLPNVVLTPHIAGSTGLECRRLGRFMVDELRRYLAGDAMEGLVTRESAQRSTHTPR